MAWTAPRTWVASEVPTAAIMNAHIRDNFLELDPAEYRPCWLLYLRRRREQHGHRVCQPTFDTPGGRLTANVAFDALVF